VNYVNFGKYFSEVGGDDVPGAAPCVDSMGAYYYFNSAPVLSALHIWNNLTDPWYMCNPNISYT